jgi:hypothetical protein
LKEEDMVRSDLDVGGAVAFWALADWTNRQRLENEFGGLGLADLVPDPRPAPACLRAALDDVFAGPRVLVRPLATRDGFAVVKEDRGLAANRYQTELTARVTGTPPALTFDPWDERAVMVEESYRRQLGRIPAAQVSTALVKVVEALGGIRLRPNGAVYWVPGPRLDEFAAAAGAVERAAENRPSCVYLLRHRLDRDAVRAVRDAVVQEVQAEAERICQEVSAGDLGARALEARKRQAFDLRGKVLLYEDLLSVGLQGLHTAVDAADQAAATATMLLASRPEIEPAAAVG